MSVASEVYCHSWIFQQVKIHISSFRTVFRTLLFYSVYKIFNLVFLKQNLLKL